MLQDIKKTIKHFKYCRFDIDSIAYFKMINQLTIKNPYIILI